MIPIKWIQDAEKRLCPYILKTPLTYDPKYNIYLKWENHQVTGSFKVRGTINKVLTLRKWEQSKGLITASAGNHGLGLAKAGRLVGAPVTIFISENASKFKLDALNKLDVNIHLVSGGYGQVEKTALKYADQKSLTWISPYNDGHVIAGQGTLGQETINQLLEHSKIDIDQTAWIIPVGGGGLIAGVSVAIKTISPIARIIGVQSSASPYMNALYTQGNQDAVAEFPSIADGLAGPVEEGSITIPLVKKYVSEIMLVSEEEIKLAISTAQRRYGERIEGSAATALALIYGGKIKQRPCIIIITGGNIDNNLHSQLCGKYIN